MLAVHALAGRSVVVACSSGPLRPSGLASWPSLTSSPCRPRKRTSGRAGPSTSTSSLSSFLLPFEGRLLRAAPCCGPAQLGLARPSARRASFLPAAELKSSLSPFPPSSYCRIITDRFAPPSATAPALTSPIPATCDPNDQTWCGGTWRSIIDKLDYIQNMGMDAIWISSVVPC